MSLPKSKPLTREQAAELYRDLKNTMSKNSIKKAPPAGGDDIKNLAKTIAASISKGIAKDAGKSPGAIESFAREESNDAVTRMQLTQGSGSTGQYAAIATVILFAFMKVVVGFIDALGVGDVSSAHASMQMSTPVALSSTPNQKFSKEEVAVLTSLDMRRSELEARSRRMDDQESDLSRREKEFVGKLSQLRELTEQLKVDREKNEKHKSAQLDQLANVYGSMAPNEAAPLIEQLDITIALAILERMPEKRLGQILALMNSERALAITKLLSEKGA